MAMWTFTSRGPVPDGRSGTWLVRIPKALNLQTSCLKNSQPIKGEWLNVDEQARFNNKVVIVTGAAARYRSWSSTTSGSIRGAQVVFGRSLRFCLRDAERYSSPQKNGDAIIVKANLETFAGAQCSCCSSH